MQYVQIIVEGKVQGVFYRKYTLETAVRLHLKGFVCNRNDGSVYIEAGGDASNIQQLIEWCHKGPGKADVSDVHVIEIEAKELPEFQIRKTER